MQLERTKNTIKSLASGLIYKMINLLMPFVIRSIIIRVLSIEYAGLSSLFTSIFQVLSLSELGFATVVAYTMYKPIVDDDKDLICALLKFIRNIYYIIGSGMLVIGFILAPFLPHFISGEYPSDMNLYVLYFIFLINTVISYFNFAYKGVLLAAHQKNDIENNIQSVAIGLAYTAQIILLLVCKNYYYYILVMPFCTVFTNLLRSYIVDKRYPEYKAKGNLDKKEKKLIYKNIGYLAGHKLVNIIVMCVINIIISAYLGLKVLAVYNNYYSIINGLIGVMTVFYASFAAGVGNSIVINDVNKNYRDFKVLSFLNVWLTGWITICLVCLFQPFMTIWVGGEYLLSTESMLLFAAMFYLWKFKEVVNTYKDAGGIWKADFWKPYVVIGVSIGLAFALVKPFGVNGTLFAMIVGFFVVSMPWETHVLFRDYFKKNTLPYYIRMFIYTVAVILAGAGTYYVCSIVPGAGYVAFFLRLIICALLPNLLFVAFSFKTPEFRFVLNKLRDMSKKKKGSKNDKAFEQNAGGESEKKAEEKQDRGE